LLIQCKSITTEQKAHIALEMQASDASSELVIVGSKRTLDGAQASSQVTSCLDNKPMQLDQKEKADRALLRFFATSAIPYLAVENQFFEDFCSIIRPTYSIPFTTLASLSTLLYDEFSSAKCILYRCLQPLG
jgi:hypothetical protein